MSWSLVNLRGNKWAEDLVASWRRQEMRLAVLVASASFSSGPTGKRPTAVSVVQSVAGHSLRFLARPSACRVRVQRCTHSEKLRLLWSAL